MSGGRKINISDIIEERKSSRKEWAEERRKNDLELIKSINRKNGDGVDPLNLFPKEMWEMIFKNVSDHQSLENMWDTCTLFRAFLEDRRTSEILFSKALETDAFYFALKDSRYTCRSWVNPRRVCKSWRYSIDQEQAKRLLKRQIEINEHPRNDPQFIFFEPCLLATYADGFAENSIKRMLKLEETFNTDVTGAPKRLFNQILKVQIQPGRAFLTVDFTQWANSITKALQHVGSEIWNLEFTAEYVSLANVAGMVIPEIYKLLVKWVSMMPNLQCLTLSISSGNEVPDPVLDQVIRELPFPSMKKLKQLEITFGEEEDSTRILEVVLSSKHVGLDNLIVWNVVPELMMEVRIIQLIQSLNLTSFTFHKTPCVGLEILDKLLNFKWPLKHINLSLDVHQMSFPQLFRMLEKFQTLESVGLELYFEMVLEDEGEAYLNLPNLNSFSLYMFCVSLMISNLNEVSGIDYFCSIDYLLPCKKLEKLTWSYECQEKVKESNLGRKEDAIEFNTGFVDFTRSNIWNVFPFLNWLKPFRKYPQPRVFFTPINRVVKTIK